MESLAIPKLSFADEVQLPEDGSWPKGTNYLYVDETSVRPLEISYDNDELQVRLFQGSSLDDYQLALRLVKTIAEHYNALIRPEDNDVMDVERFTETYNEKWAQEHCLTMVRMLVSMYQREKGKFSMAGVRKELKAGPRFMESLLHHPDEFSTKFFERFKRLQYIDKEKDLYVAGAKRLTSKDGALEVVFAVWTEGVSTLISGDVDVVILQGLSDPELHIPIALDSLDLVLADEACWLGDGWLLLPALEGDPWRQIATAAEAYQLEDMLEVGHDVTPTQTQDMGAFSGRLKDRLSAEEWRKLSNAPFLVFLAVASADGNIDKKELNVFAQIASQAAINETGPFQEVLQHGEIDAQQILQDLTSGTLELPEEIHQVAAIIDRSCAPADAFQFKLGLWSLGKKVAEASGGGLFGIGKKVSEAEKTVLAGMAMVLGITGK